MTKTDINGNNINFWLVDGQHTIQAAKEILANPKYSVSVEARKKSKESWIHQLNLVLCFELVVN